MNKEIHNLISQSQNIVVFTGAGISTNSGIPDFRSEGGLYEIVGKEYVLPYPEAIFDIDYFRKDPKPFFKLSKNLLSEQSIPTKCHRFVAGLEEAGKISLVITQNIDHLHQDAGNQKVLECHGTYDHGHCIECGKGYDISYYRETMLKGDIPRCDCSGVVKPDIVFFGEQLPVEFYEAYKKPPKADLILILGTSLKVQPAAGLALKIAERVPSVIVNKDPTDYDRMFDFVVHEDLDEFVKNEVLN